MKNLKLKPGDPYCSACGYPLMGAEHSANCPECGRPLVQVLVRSGGFAPARMYRYQSAAKLFGLPVISIAFGPDFAKSEKHGRAKGIIAIGDSAIGGLAIGGASIGIVAIGGASIGWASIGGAALGAGCAMGGAALGGFAVGGGAVGVMASGGAAVGVIAQGGGALGLYARGPGAQGQHVISPRQTDSAAVEIFKGLEVVLGSTPASMMSTPAAWAAAMTATLAVIIGLVAALALIKGPRGAVSSRLSVTNTSA